MTRSTRTLALACVAVCATVLAACGGGHKAKQTPPPTPTTSTTTSASPSPTQPPAKAVNPFTGLGPSQNPVVAVKIDDTANGRPQLNITLADMVYVEQVEGGLTRLLAIYNTHLPSVEAVRSTRANDPELVEQFGPIAYVASGGAPNPLSVLDHSNLKATINDRGGPGFTRDGNRGAPYNLVANLLAAARALHGPKAKSIGLGFSDSVSAYVRAPRALGVNTVVGATPVRFDWNASLKRYVRVIDGAVQHDANRRVIGTPNVIVQFCSVTPYPQDVDVVGNVAQFTHTTGRGRVVIFRNGHAIQGTWMRGSTSSGTKYVGKDGHTIPLATGGAWVLLVATNAPLSS